MALGRNVLGGEQVKQLRGSRKLVGKKVFDSTNFPFDAFRFTEYDKTDEAVLKMADGWSLYVGEDAFFGYYSPTGNGTVSAPVEEDYRLRADDAAIYLEQYLNGGWSDVNKMSFGLMVGISLLNMMSCRGLIHPDADTNDLTDLVPTQNFHMIDCETADFQDQFGNIPDTLTNEDQSSAWSKFGSYSFFADSGTVAEMSFDDGLDLSNPCGFYGVINMPEFSLTYDDRGYLWQALYQVDSSNLWRARLYVRESAFYLDFMERVGGSWVQDVTIHSDVGDPWPDGEHAVACIIDVDDTTISLMVDGDIYTGSIVALTLTGSATSNKVIINTANDTPGTPDEGWPTYYLDDILYAADDDCDMDLFINHYLSDEAWSTSEYSYADMIEKCAPGGKIVKVGDQKITGQLEIAGASRVKAKRSASQSITSSVVTKLLYDVEVFDNLNEYASGTFTAIKSGSYFLKASMLFNNAMWTEGTYASLIVYKNASLHEYLDWNEVENTATIYFELNGSTIVELAAGDTIDIRVFQNSGGSRGLYPNGDYNVFTIHQLS